MKVLLSFFTICILCLSTAYGQSKVLVIGEQTKLQTEIIGKRKIEKKQIERQSNEKTQEKVSLSADIEEVHVNAAGFEPNGFAKNPYLKAAMDKKLPIIIENVKKSDLEELTGFGIDAKTVVVQATEKVRGVRVVIVEEDETANKDLKKQSLPRGLSEGGDYSETSGVVDTTKLSPKQLQQMRKKETPKVLPNKPIRPKQEIQNQKRVVPTLKERSGKTKEAIQKIKTSTDGGEQGYISAESTDYYVSTNPMFMTDRDLNTNPGLSKYARSSYKSEAELIINLPDYAKYYVDLVWLKGWSSTWDSQGARMDVSYDIWLYATTLPAAKYMLIREKGRASPGTLAKNNSRERGYFTENYWQQFGIYYNRGYLEKSAPQNANNQTNVSTTTGFSVGANAGADASGPSVGVSASYSESTTVSQNIPDFRVTNSSNNQYVKMNYGLSNCGGGAYSSWKSLKYQKFFETAKIHSVPGWATGNMYPYAEGVWKYAKDHNRSETLYFDQIHKMRRVKENNNSIWSYSYSAWWKTYRYYIFPSVDFRKVQIPHLGINAQASQSSTGWNGHASRAIDGDVNGNYGGNSVTHTNHAANPWWEAVLGAQYANTVLQNIDIWNRTDCCGDRLSNYYVFVSDVPFTSKDLNTTIAQANNGTGNTSVYAVTNGNQQVRKININRTGRYIRVQLKNAGYLSLAEVRIVPKGYH